MTQAPNTVSSPRETPSDRILRPLQEFIHHSASSGLVLMAATVVALLLANTALADQYNEVLHTNISIQVGDSELEYSLLHWINDGLMAIFFLLVGLEIKREALVGELSNLRAALLPIIAAIGGALVPALIYIMLNRTGAASQGWAIPMATDIAFTLGILALLGKRVPFALKIFMTAVAIVDDLMAVLIIAFFYSNGIDATALGLGLLLLGIMFAANLLGIRNLIFYLGLGLLVWLAFLQSGVHATVAGVLIAWVIPARNRIDPAAFLERAQNILVYFASSQMQSTKMLTDEVQQSAVAELEDACEQVQAPLQRLEHSLHLWVSFLIMPIFALANAGVSLSLNSLEGESSRVALGIILGLVVGKPLGLLGAVWLAVHSGIASLPSGVQWSHMVGIGCLAGIGFTMSLFIASLGLDAGELEVAKLGILTASVIAGSLGFVLLRRQKISSTEAG